MEFIPILLLCCIATFRATLGAPTDAAAVPFMFNMSIFDYIQANKLSPEMHLCQSYWTDETTKLSCGLNLTKQTADLYLAKDWSHFNKLDVPSICQEFASIDADGVVSHFNDSLDGIPITLRNQFTNEERNQIVTSVTTGCRVEGAENMMDVPCLLGKLAQAVAFFEERVLSPYLPFRALARIILQVYHDCNSAGSIADNLLIEMVSHDNQLPGCFIQATEKVVSTLEWSLKDLITTLPGFKKFIPDKYIRQILPARSMMSQPQGPSVTLV